MSKFLHSWTQGSPTHKFISEHLRVSLKTIHDVKKLGKEGIGPDHRPGTGLTKSKCTPDFMKQLLNQIAADLIPSICSHARMMGVSHPTILTEVKKLGLRSFVRRKQQLIVEKTKERWLERSKKILC